MKVKIKNNIPIHRSYYHLRGKNIEVDEIPVLGIKNPICLVDAMVGDILPKEANIFKINEKSYQTNQFEIFKEDIK